MQMPITNSKIQPSVSILFNKALDTNTEPLKVKILKTFWSWWTLSKFRDSKGYLRRQYEHGTAIYTATNGKAANFPFSPFADIQKRTKRQEQGKNYIPYQTWILNTPGFKATLVCKFLRRPPTTIPFWAPQRLQLSLVRVPEEDAVSSSISEPQLQKMLLRKRKEKVVWR